MKKYVSQFKKEIGEIKIIINSKNKNKNIILNQDQVNYNK